MGPHQNKKLLHSKGNNQETKRQQMEREKIFANDISDKGLVSKIYTVSIQNLYRTYITQHPRNGQKT